MAGIDPDEVRTLATLSRLALTDAEVSGFARELDAIVTYIRRLCALDVAQVPEFMSPRMPESSLQDDTIGPVMPTEVSLANAPRRRGSLVVVPKFKED